MRHFLCRFGIHKWLKWKNDRKEPFQERACEWCGKAQLKKRVY